MVVQPSGIFRQGFSCACQPFRLPPTLMDFCLCGGSRSCGPQPSIFASCGLLSLAFRKFQLFRTQSCRHENGQVDIVHCSGKALDLLCHVLSAFRQPAPRELGISSLLGTFLLFCFSVSECRASSFLWLRLTGSVNLCHEVSWILLAVGAITALNNPVAK
ncbi:hypothetical protein MPH_07697 [Macrophomina phaseolina MS6]|uniref:Uncharacterized protein n=1 Tax=Macrophomina phaseolina (strain MS6) TaxID=1126212 RepID=K2SE22_MACPH|nr:hypothetical protein MPH_07697 [Macrophomina phaseolina MS6]